jgi:TetR/AcrR family transcriptional repressor of nem operon
MKVSREQAAENRERILDVAAALFRERGFDGIGVADLMKTAGLTHGGFYGHFASKEDLMAEACARALARSADSWAQVAENTAEQPLAKIKAHYLSAKHRDNASTGCLVAALGSDVARQGTKVRHAVTEGICAFIELFARLSQAGTKAKKRKEAITVLATLVGAIVLARAADDQKLSNEILRAVAARADD